jgi:hypothetical protein
VGEWVFGWQVLLHWWLGLGNWWLGLANWLAFLLLLYWRFLLAQFLVNFLYIVFLFAFIMLISMRSLTLTLWSDLTLLFDNLTLLFILKLLFIVGNIFHFWTVLFFIDLLLRLFPEGLSILIILFLHHFIRLLLFHLFEQLNQLHQPNQFHNPTRSCTNLRQPAGFSHFCKTQRHSHIRTGTHQILNPNQFQDHRQRWKTINPEIKLKTVVFFSNWEKQNLEDEEDNSCTMGNTEIGAGLYVEEGLVNIDGKNSVNSDDWHYNRVGLVVSKMV